MATIQGNYGYNTGNYDNNTGYNKATTLVTIAATLVITVEPFIFAALLFRAFGISKYSLPLNFAFTLQNFAFTLWNMCANFNVKHLKML